MAYEAYAWGGPAEFTVMQASCLVTRTAVITTGVQAGSLEAFATYLHSLGDYYSHRECIALMDSLGMPWATHTLTGYPACNYNPLDPQPDDAHGREFGTYPDAARTDEAIQAIYSELVNRSLQHEGRYFPLDLDTPLPALTGTLTLREALYTLNFINHRLIPRVVSLLGVVGGSLPVRTADVWENADSCVSNPPFPFDRYDEGAYSENPRRSDAGNRAGWPTVPWLASPVLSVVEGTTPDG